ncbi:nitrate reductase [uncultured Helicobacter sp.]|uniref:nitrate reductase n=1 Tax=uncultured Helicobacter sp. TaxID=175537 RepID=UPI00261D7DC1|nr:nitrate reductase [uncultured Helicobacter sp.]
MTRLKRIRIALFVIFLSLYAQSIELQDIVKTKEVKAGKQKEKIVLENNIVVTNLVGNSLLIGTDFGEVLELTLYEKSLKRIIKLPNIANFYTESYAPKVYSVDKFEDKILIHSEGNYGSKNLFLLSQGKLKNLPNIESLNIKKATFVNETQIFLGLASNEIMLYDLNKNQILYRKQLSEASFSDFALELENRNYVVACESGILYFGDIESGEVLVEMEGENRDNVYQVKLAKVGDIMTFITAGQDRKAGVYRLNLQTNVVESYGISANFLVYSVGLNKDSTLGAYMQNEQSEISIFQIVDKQEVALLSGHMSLLNNIIFTDSHLISSEDGKNILIWNLKE